MKRTRPSSSPRAIRLISLALCTAFWGALLMSANAQTAYFSQGETGTNTMSLQVPLGSYPGRGGEFAD